MMIISIPTGETRSIIHPSTLALTSASTGYGYPYSYGYYPYYNDWYSPYYMPYYGSATATATDIPTTPIMVILVADTLLLRMRLLSSLLR